MQELEKLRTELTIQGKSPRTIDAYLIHAKQFQDFIKKPLDKLNEDDIKLYLSHLMQHKIKPRSINLKLSSLRFLFNEVLKQPEIMTKIKSQKASKKLPTYLTREEISKLLNATSNIKHQLLIELMISSGLRVSECVSLKIQDINKEEKTIHVKLGKGDKDRITIISQSTLDKLKTYLEKRKNNSEYIFSTKSGKPITTKLPQKILPILTKKAGINKPITPHVLRHTFATLLLENGTNLRIIQELLGHTNLQTTQIYAHISKDQIKNIKNPLDI